MERENTFHFSQKTSLNGVEQARILEKRRAVPGSVFLPTGVPVLVYMRCTPDPTNLTAYSVLHAAYVHHCSTCAMCHFRSLSGRIRWSLEPLFSAQNGYQYL